MKVKELFEVAYARIIPINVYEVENFGLFNLTDFVLINNKITKWTKEDEVEKIIKLNHCYATAGELDQYNLANRVAHMNSKQKDSYESMEELYSIKLKTAFFIVTFIKKSTGKYAYGEHNVIPFVQTEDTRLAYIKPSGDTVFFKYDTTLNPSDLIK